jgi:hypothetical protein
MTECEFRVCHDVVITPRDDPAVPLEMQNGTSLQEILDSLNSLPPPPATIPDIPLG